MTVEIVKQEKKLHIEDHRCRCGRLLYRIRYPMVAGVYIETRCPKCGMMNVFTTYGDNHADPQPETSPASTTDAGTD